MRATAIGAVVCGWAGAVMAGDRWPGYRGPTEDGHADAREAPLTWSESAGVVWKSAVPGKGWSSPVVWGKQVWVTTATPDGGELSAVCFDLDTGKPVRNVKVFEVAEPRQKINLAASYASPSPVIEEGRLYVHFGNYGTACLDTATGKTIWEGRDLKLEHQEGAGSSPVLVGDLLIVHCDGMDVQYIAALDKATGKTVWKTARSADLQKVSADQRKASNTPLVIDTLAGKQLISVAAKAAYAYDPATGKELWKVRYKGWSNVSRPVFGHGLVYINGGFGQLELWAVRPDGSGDVTDSHVVWRLTKGVPALSSPLLVGEYLYLCSDKGVAACVEAKTGKVVWQERILGNVSASPVLAAGRLYFTGEDGRTVVLKPGPACETLATNPLNATVKASPAVVGKSLLIRTAGNLYRIE